MPTDRHPCPAYDPVAAACFAGEVPDDCTDDCTDEDADR